MMAYADILSLTGPHIRNPRNNGGSSVACGRFDIGRDRNGSIVCHGYIVLGIELQSKSLGNHHHWCNHERTNRDRWTRFVLSVFYGNRSCVHFVDNLVCLEVETRS